MGIIGKREGGGGGVGLLACGSNCSIQKKTIEFTHTTVSHDCCIYTIMPICVKLKSLTLNISLYAWT